MRSLLPLGEGASMCKQAVLSRKHICCKACMGPLRKWLCGCTPLPLSQLAAQQGWVTDEAPGHTEVVNWKVASPQP